MKTNGIRSTVRAQLFGSDAPRKTGRVAYRFLVPIEHAAAFMSAGTAGIYVGSNVALARYMIRKGSVVIDVLVDADPKAVPLQAPPKR